MVNIEGLLQDTWRFEEERTNNVEDRQIMAEVLAIAAQRRKCEQNSTKCNREADVSQSKKKEEKKMDKIDIVKFDAIYNECYQLAEAHEIMIVSLATEFEERLKDMGFLDTIQKLAIYRGKTIHNIYEKQAFMMAWGSNLKFSGE